MLGKGLESLIPPQNNQQNNQSSLNNAQNNTQLNNHPQSDNLINQNQTAKEELKQNSDNLSFNQNSLNNEKINNQNEKQQNEIQKISKDEIKITKEEKNENLYLEKENINNYQYPQKKESVFYIETQKIRPNPHQPRREFNEESINELAASIRQFGIIQPLVVTKIEKEIPTGTEIEYELIAGERRWLAAKKLGLETVPAIIKSIETPKERLELAIIENIQRENLNPIETARAFARLQDEFRLTQREIAARLGKSREAVANSLRLLDLPKRIQDAIATGKISETHGRMLLAITDPKIQQKIFEDLINYNLSTRELKRKINLLSLPSKKENKAKLIQDNFDPEIKMLEEKLKLTLGTPVKIYRDGKNGKIIIEFYSDEEFKNIISKLNISEG